MNSNPEQRREARAALRVEATVEPLSDRFGLGDRFEVTVREASRRGLLLLSGTAMEVGSHWRILLTDHGDSVATVPVVVRHCREQSGGFLVGCEVRLEPFVLRWLGAEPTPGTGADPCIEPSPFE